MDLDTDEHTLVPSTNSGRFALDDAVHGPDLSCGQGIEVLLGGHWVSGCVEFSRISSISAQTLGDVQKPTRYYDGYYFIASSDSTVCALMVGMRVRLK